MNKLYLFNFVLHTALCFASCADYSVRTVANFAGDLYDIENYEGCTGSIALKDYSNLLKEATFPDDLKEKTSRLSQILGSAHTPTAFDSMPASNPSREEIVPDNEERNFPIKEAINKRNEFARRVVESLKALEIPDMYDYQELDPKKVCFIHTGISGHAMYMEVRRTSDRHFILTIFNSGLGIDEYHQRRVFGIRTLYLPIIIIEDIPFLEDYLAVDFFRMVYCLKKPGEFLLKNDWNIDIKCFYEYLLSIFEQKQFVDLSGEAWKDYYIHPQESGTCTYYGMHVYLQFKLASRRDYTFIFLGAGFHLLRSIREKKSFEELFRKLEPNKRGNIPRDEILKQFHVKKLFKVLIDYFKVISSTLKGKEKSPYGMFLDPSYFTAAPSTELFDLKGPVFSHFPKELTLSESDMLKTIDDQLDDLLEKFNAKFRVPTYNLLVNDQLDDLLEKFNAKFKIPTYDLPVKDEFLTPKDFGFISELVFNSPTLALCAIDYNVEIFFSSIFTQPSFSCYNTLSDFQRSFLFFLNGSKDIYALDAFFLKNYILTITPLKIEKTRPFSSRELDDIYEFSKLLCSSYKSLTVQGRVKDRTDFIYATAFLKLMYIYWQAVCTVDPEFNTIMPPLFITKFLTDDRFAFYNKDTLDHFPRILTAWNDDCTSGLGRSHELSMFYEIPKFDITLIPYLNNKLGEIEHKDSEALSFIKYINVPFSKGNNDPCKSLPDLELVALSVLLSKLSRNDCLKEFLSANPGLKHLTNLLDMQHMLMDLIVRRSLIFDFEIKPKLTLFEIFQPESRIVDSVNDVGYLRYMDTFVSHNSLYDEAWWMTSEVSSNSKFDKYYIWKTRRRNFLCSLAFFYGGLIEDSKMFVDSPELSLTTNLLLLNDRILLELPESSLLTKYTSFRVVTNDSSQKEEASDFILAIYEKILEQLRLNIHVFKLQQDKKSAFVLEVLYYRILGNFYRDQLKVDDIFNDDPLLNIYDCFIKLLIADYLYEKVEQAEIDVKEKLLASILTLHFMICHDSAKQAESIPDMSTRIQVYGVVFKYMSLMNATFTSNAATLTGVVRKAVEALIEGTITEIKPSSSSLWFLFEITAERADHVDSEKRREESSRYFVNLFSGVIMPVSPKFTVQDLANTCRPDMNANTFLFALKKNSISYNSLLAYDRTRETRRLVVFEFQNFEINLALTSPKSCYCVDDKGENYLLVEKVQNLFINPLIENIIALIRLSCSDESSIHYWVAYDQLLVTKIEGNEKKIRKYIYFQYSTCSLTIFHEEFSSLGWKNITVKVVCPDSSLSSLFTTFEHASPYFYFLNDSGGTHIVFPHRNFILNSKPLIIKKVGEEFFTDIPIGSCKIIPAAPEGVSPQVSRNISWLHRILFPFLLVSEEKTSKIFYLIPSMLEDCMIMPACPVTGFPFDSLLANDDLIVLCYHFMKLRLYKYAWKYAKLVTQSSIYTERTLKFITGFLCASEQSAATVMIQVYLSYQVYLNSLIFNWDLSKRFYPGVAKIFDNLIAKYCSRFNLSPSYISDSIPPMLDFARLQDMCNSWFTFSFSLRRRTREGGNPIFTRTAGLTSRSLEVFSSRINATPKDVSTFSDDLNIFDIRQSYLSNFWGNYGEIPKNILLTRIRRIFIFSYGYFGTASNGFGNPRFNALGLLNSFYLFILHGRTATHTSEFLSKLPSRSINFKLPKLPPIQRSNSCINQVLKEEIPQISKPVDSYPGLASLNEAAKAFIEKLVSEMASNSSVGSENILSGKFMSISVDKMVAFISMKIEHLKMSIYADASIRETFPIKKDFLNILILRLYNDAQDIKVNGENFIICKYLILQVFLKQLNAYKEHALKNFADSFAAFCQCEHVKIKPFGFHYPLSKYWFILIFEGTSSKVLLRSDQFEDLEKVLFFILTGNSYALQKMMGGGKTSVLSIIAIMAAQKLGLLFFFLTLAPLIASASSIFYTGLFPFHLKPMVLNVVRNYTGPGLSLLLNVYYHVRDFQKNSIFFVATPSFIQSLQNMFSELNYLKLKRPEEFKPNHEVFLKLIARILYIISEHGFSILDEADTALDPKREHNFPTKTRITVDQSAILAIGLLHSLLRNVIKKSSNFEALRKEDCIGMMKTILTQYPSSCDVGSSSLTGPQLDLHNLHLSVALDEDFDGLVKKVDGFATCKCGRIKLSLLNYVHNVFRAVVLKVPNLDYGLSKKKASKFDRNLYHTIPFAYANTPKENSLFADPWKTIGYTFEFYLREGVSIKLLEYYFDQGTLLVSNLCILGNSFESLSKAPSLKPYIKVFGDSFLEGVKPDFDKVQQRLNENRFLLVTLLTDVLFSNFSVHPEQVYNYALNVPSIFKFSVYLSGTFKNRSIFPLHMTNPKKAKDSINLDEGIKIEADIRNQVKLYGTPVSPLPDLDEDLASKKDIVEVFKELKNVNGGFGPDVCTMGAFLDVGAYFKKYSSEEIADGYLRHCPGKLHVLYTSDEDELVLLSRTGSAQRFGKTLYALKTDEEKKEIQKYLLVIYEQARTVGTDIDLADDTVGLVFVSELVSKSALMQAIMRLRKFLRPNQQKIIFCVSPALLKTLNELGQGINYESIWVHAQKVEEDLILSENYFLQFQRPFVKVASKLRKYLIDQVCMKENYVETESEIMIELFDYFFIRNINPFYFKVEKTPEEEFNGFFTSLAKHQQTLLNKFGIKTRKKFEMDPSLKVPDRIGLRLTDQTQEQEQEQQQEQQNVQQVETTITQELHPLNSAGKIYQHVTLTKEYFENCFATNEDVDLYGFKNTGVKLSSEDLGLNEVFDMDDGKSRCTESFYKVYDQESVFGTRHQKDPNFILYIFNPSGGDINPILFTLFVSWEDTEDIIAMGKIDVPTEHKYVLVCSENLIVLSTNASPREITTLFRQKSFCEAHAINLLIFADFIAISTNPLFLSAFLEWLYIEPGRPKVIMKSVVESKTNWVSKWLEMFSPSGFLIFNKVIQPCIANQSLLVAEACLRIPHWNCNEKIVQDSSDSSNNTLFCLKDNKEILTILDNAPENEVLAKEWDFSDLKVSIHIGSGKPVAGIMAESRDRSSDTEAKQSDPTQREKQPEQVVKQVAEQPGKPPEE